MINFENKNEGMWFYADDDNHKLGSIRLRVLSTEEYQRIEAITTRTKKKFKSGVAYDDVTTDETLAAKLRWRYCITDWADLQLNGEAVVCNDASKVEMCKSMEFLDWIVVFLEELTEKTTALDEARLGNSSDSSSGVAAKKA